MPDDIASADEIADNLEAEVAAMLSAGNPAEVAAQVSASVKRVFAPLADDLAASAKQIAEGNQARAELGRQLSATELNLAEVGETVRRLQDAAATQQPTADTAAPSMSSSVDANVYNPHAIGAALDGKFEAYHEFIRSVHRAERSERMIMLPDEGDISAALDGEALGAGGVLVPEEFRAQILRLMLADTMTIRSRSMVLPMGSQTLTIPRLDDEDWSEGNLFGGVITYWTGVGAEIPESEPKFKDLTLTCNTLHGLVPVPNTMLADSFVSVPGLLTMMFSDALNWEENRSFMRGSGSGQPLGFLNSDALVKVARKAGEGDVDAEDIHAMEGRLLPGSAMNAVYLYHPGLSADLGKLNLGGVQYWQEDLSRTRPTTINGRMAIPFGHCSPPGTSGDIVLADLSHYLIGDRQAMTMDQSSHVGFKSHRTYFKTTCRLDGQPWIDRPIILPQGGEAHSVSPFVALA